MRLHSKFSQRGLSLLELILVLAVAAMILLFVAGRYKQSQWEHEVSVTQRSVQTLLQALNHYFYKHCNSRDFATKFENASDLLNDLPPDMITNPLGAKFSVRIDEIPGAQEGQPLYQLRLLAEYPNVVIADTLRGQLGADAAAEVQPGSTLIWTRLPAVATADPSSAYWIQSEVFNQQVTEGLRAYGGLFIGVCNNRGPKPKP